MFTRQSKVVSSDIGSMNTRFCDSSGAMVLDNQISSAHGVGNSSRKAGGSNKSSVPQVLVGKGAQISGDVFDTKSLVVSGNAQVKASNLEFLSVTREGRLKGEITVVNACIEGYFSGNMEVTDKLSIKAGAVVDASIVYKRIEIESGGSISGNITQKEHSQNPDYSEGGGLNKSESSEPVAVLEDA